MGLRRGLVFLALAFSLLSCGTESKKEKKKISEPNKPTIITDVPLFNADSAFHYVADQVNFGPRIPNTRAHRLCATFLVEKLNSFGFTVEEQNFEETAYDGTFLYLKNIIGTYNQNATQRILLAAHWDTRPFADKDQENPDATFDGANDAASAVGVLLEIARILAQQPPQNIGIDIIFFDGEDWGEKIGERAKSLPDHLVSWWCLGSQYWANNKHRTNYGAYYGILLDMVGAPNATFYKEAFSYQNAPLVLDKVWKTGKALGYGRYFKDQRIGEITDDHQFVTMIAKIPMIDIIDYKPGTFFFEHHHTQKDNLENISKQSLKAVGETVVQVLYLEDQGSI